MGAVASAVTGGGGGGGGKGGFLGGVVDSVGDVFQGAVDAVSSVVEPVVEAVGSAVETTVEAVSDAGVGIDEGVRDTVPGGWVTVGAIAATVATAGAAGAGMFAAEGAAVGAEAAAIGAEAAAVGAETTAWAAEVAATAAESAAAVAEGGAIAAEGVMAGAETIAEVGAYTAETAATVAETGTAWTAEVAATQEAVQTAALQKAAETAGMGALKGAGITALKQAVTTGEINPEGLLKGAATGAVGAGIGSLAGGSLADYGSTVSKMGGSLAGGLAGGTTGALLNGGDIGQGIVSGGISGLAGATSIGAGAGLQSAGLDPVSSQFLTNAAIGAGKAAVGGGDALTGAIGSTIGTAANMGLNATGNALYGAAKDAGFSSTGINNVAEAAESPEQKLTQLAASNVASDAALSPLEEAVGKMGSSVQVLNPETGLPIGQEQTAEEKQYTQQLLEALYPNVAVQGAEGALKSEQEATTTPQDLSNIDSTGNVYDKSGAVVSSAVELGLIKGTDATGNDVWITQTGDFIPVTTENQTSAQPSDIANQLPVTTPSMGTTVSDTFGTGDSESSLDNPQEIINNADGSVTIIENDGTQRIFNTDGSVTIIDVNGKSSEEFGPKPAEEEKPAESSTPSGSGALGSLVNSLLGPTLGGTVGKTSGGGMGWLPAAAGIGAGIGAGIAANNAPVQSDNPFNLGKYGFDWGAQAVNPADNGVAYGQNFFAPKFVKQAAEGGLMSIPNSVQPTLTNNGLSIDPSSSVQMYTKGGKVDHETMQIVKHLRSGGAPMHHIAGFLDYRNKMMAKGGSLGSYSDGGSLLKGRGDGMSDDIPASIAGVQPARLANEEFVIPADVVSHLGNGSSEAGAKVLYDMLDKVRKARTGHTKQGKQINPHKLMPKVGK